MSDLRKAAQQALEALLHRTGGSDEVQRIDAAITALCAALAQEQAEPVQEPVAWIYPDDYAGILKHQSRAEVFQKAWCNPAVCVPLYTTPPQRPPLTDEEIMELWKRYIGPISFASAVIARTTQT